MKIENIPQSTAEKYHNIIKELRPEWQVSVDEEDINLYHLGFVSEIPCSLFISASDDELCDLYYEIIDMETEIYANEKLLYAPIWKLNEEERKVQQKLLLQEEKYRRYQPLEGVLFYNLKNI